MELAIAKAKRNVRIMKANGKFTNFIKGRGYKCMLRDDDIVIIDEDKHNFVCNINIFDKEFELLS